MAINTLEYAQVLNTALDQQLTRVLTSSWMDDNAGEVIYTGGNEIKIPSISLQGLADYDRDEGFVQGAVTLSYQTMAMTQDRNRTFSLDAMDVDETNFVASAATVASEFQRTCVIPEIDKYRYSKIYALLNAKSRVETGYTPVEATVVAKLTEHIRLIQDVVGEETELVITLSPSTKGLIADYFRGRAGRYDTANFKRGAIETRVNVLDEIPLLPAPSDRLKTLYESLDGKTAGQEEGGFKVAAGAKDINWIITPKKAPIAVTKQDKTRIFTPDQNQKADAWKIDYRRYHDLWIKENQLMAGFACTK